MESCTYRYNEHKQCTSNINFCSCQYNSYKVLNIPKFRALLLHIYLYITVHKDTRMEGCTLLCSVCIVFIAIKT